jgi:hypothetical protein
MSREIRPSSSLISHEIKPLSPHHQLVIGLHWPDGVIATGLLLCFLTSLLSSGEKGTKRLTSLPRTSAWLTVLQVAVLQQFGSKLLHA